MENFFPEILIQYLLPFRQAFSKPGFGYFQGFIAALLLSQGRKCISHIANTCFFIDKSLSSWERFLASAQWDLPSHSTSDWASHQTTGTSPLVRWTLRGGG